MVLVANGNQKYEEIKDFNTLDGECYANGIMY